MTEAQREALRVLGENDGEWVGASKRRSSSADGKRIANVNMIAAEALRAKGLADNTMWTAYSGTGCADRYRINAAGREALSVSAGSKGER